MLQTTDKPNLLKFTTPNKQAYALIDISEYNAQETYTICIYTLDGKRMWLRTDRKSRCKIVEIKQSELSDFLGQISFINPNAKIIDVRQKNFPIVRLSRIDLMDLYKNHMDIPRNEMSKLADKMANDYFEQLYWTSLKLLAESYIKQRQKKNRG